MNWVRLELGAKRLPHSQNGTVVTVTQAEAGNGAAAVFLGSTERVGRKVASPTFKRRLQVYVAGQRAVGERVALGELDGKWRFFFGPAAYIFVSYPF